MRNQIQEKAAIRGLRPGAPFVLDPAQREVLPPGKGEHTDGDALRALRRDVYSKVSSLQSPHGICHRWHTVRTKLRVGTLQANPQSSTAFAELEFAGINHFRRMQGFSVSLGRIPV